MLLSNSHISPVITKSTLGATIGNITVSAPACADDIALLGESKDIQAMLNLLEYNTKTYLTTDISMNFSKFHPRVLFFNQHIICSTFLHFG
jgi:hypothetical protein